MKENIIRVKSFTFAIRIIRMSQFLVNNKQEFVISKQLLRSGTSIGAMIREAEHAESFKDFIHKIAIATKESNETLYWLELLNATEYFTPLEFESIYHDANEIMKLLVSILKTSKAKAIKEKRSGTHTKFA